MYLCIQIIITGKKKKVGNLLQQQSLISMTKKASDAKKVWNKFVLSVRGGCKQWRLLRTKGLVAYVCGLC